jgi:transmembrane sensor
MKNTDKYKNSDWEKLAAKFSGEKTDLNERLERFSEDDELETEKFWKEIGGMNGNNGINVDKAWANVNSKIRENKLEVKTIAITGTNRLRTILSLAATALVIIGLGSALLYLSNNGYFSRNIVISSAGDQRNVTVTLPDGSKVWLNRNSELSYSPEPGKIARNVKLKGEAFFEITPDKSKPFIIDAGKANVKVVGTSFNVITSNLKQEVEVFVKTGTVVVSDVTGNHELILKPGDVGTVNTEAAIKSKNINPNYLAWKTDTLVYDGQKLDVVFADLKRVHNINVVSEDPDILNQTITTIFDQQPQDTIIRIICTTFNFSYTKDGSVYHLSK